MTENELDLMHRYLDGAITEEELAVLEDLLRRDADARAMLRSLATIDAKWQSLTAGDSGVLTVEETDRSRQRPSGYTVWLALLAVAASLVFAAFGWFRNPADPQEVSRRGIARVIRIEGEGNVNDRKVVDGAELYAGEQLDVAQGLIELAFRETGVHVVATAPLIMTLSSDQHVSLREGQVKLVVPPQGVGFVVDTAQRKFVDLGTSFVVTASSRGSEVLVLDGQISVDDHDGSSVELMHEGEFARYDQNGESEKRSPSNVSRAIPELTLAATEPQHGPLTRALTGSVFGYDRSTLITKSRLDEDVIANTFLPLVRSQFQDRSCLDVLKQSEAIGFRGIAGAYHEFPGRIGLAPFSQNGGWMAWYRGKVRPPKKGRYRFWGYADNHMLVAIDGKPVFEGSRHDSPFKDLGIPRENNPALPCLIAPAGFACSEWVQLDGEPIELDLLFGEIGGNITSGLLLVERAGDQYEETFWGQPKWPLFLTDVPTDAEKGEFERLVDHIEQQTMGSFSVVEDAVWKRAD